MGTKAIFRMIELRKMGYSYAAIAYQIKNEGLSKTVFSRVYIRKKIMQFVPELACKSILRFMDLKKMVRVSDLDPIGGNDDGD